MWWLKLAQVGKKYWSQIAIAGAAVGILGWVYDMGGDNREAALRSEMAKQFQEQAQADIDAFAEKKNKEIEQLKASHARAFEAYKNERDTKDNADKVSENVDRTEISADCHDLAVDTISLLQQSARIGISSNP